MSLIKRLEEANVEKKSTKQKEEEKDPYSSLKMKIQNKVKEYIMLLFTTDPGIAMMAFSTLNQILGIIMIRKIVNIDM